MTKLEYIEKNLAIKPKASVILLHGLGADGHDFESMVEALSLPKETSIRFVFPHAPIRPITINAGMHMRGWYDIIALSLNAREDEKGIRETSELVIDLIEQEHARGIAYNKIVLAGFSQGGAIALYTGLRYSQELAGVIALSTYLPLASKLSLEASAVNRKIPIFMAHGLYDAVVPLMLAQMSLGLLQTLGYSVEWHTYSMEHSICLPEIKDISQWLQVIL